MTQKLIISFTAASVFLFARSVAAETQPQALSLQQAQDTAMRRYPRVKVADLQSLMARQDVKEARASFFPTVNGELTAVGTPTAGNNILSAGNLQVSSIYSRQADGVNINQLITDFGRTANLFASSKLHSRAQEQNALATRQQILVSVDAAYFNALEAQSVLEVARQTVTTRQYLYQQVEEMVTNNLKSDLDANFAEVDLADSQLLLASAETDLQSAFASLANLLGEKSEATYTLADEPLHVISYTNDWSLIQTALTNRPDISQLRFEHESAGKFARAEKGLNYPTVNAFAAAGILPVHNEALVDNYEAAGVNIQIPLFDGFLFSAREEKAKLAAEVATENLRNAEDDLVRDVHYAILNRNLAIKRLQLTAKLLESANKAFELARDRYQVGSVSIVELSQAQLNQTEAKIREARAKYQYQVRNASLNYQLGVAGRPQ